ncbi:exo-beta-N-acetylmuramidase NamZ domain-containing protein [Paraglaciecola sp. 2405UD69-4]|uniref:exo-beta-N-acetylmuramidase NamZ family protein n=1 Tax=Paraglaciecola sp. 2405UD69-4 TaxID=3391836 RepID=UPI0039C8CE85
MKLVAFFSLIIVLCLSACTTNINPASEKILVGASQSKRYLPLLKGKRVALVVNQTSRVGNSHLVDFLLSKHINLVRIFAPEHGFRGDHDAGAHVENGLDSKTGIPITSIYGDNKKPSKDIMDTIDIVIFDIQDVGARFYTYISSMHYMMEAAAESNTQFLVLDRPNPNGKFVDGPTLDLAYQSFVGMHPIPLLHGMTIAELALMIKGESWISDASKLQLFTISVANYNRNMHYDLPVAPSPNLPNSQAVQLYPSLCFFEATPLSVGRGTDFPFQVIGHNLVSLGEFAFTPISKPGAALHPKLENQALLGINLQQSTQHGLDLTLFIEAYRQFQQAGITFFEHSSFMDKLAGTNKLRIAIENGNSLQQIQTSWEADLQAFKQQRKPYLLYPE